MGNTTSFLLATALTLLSVCVLKAIAPKLGLIDVPGGRKKHTTSIPVVGGLAMFLGFAGAQLASSSSPQTLPFLVSSLILVAIGVLDDIKEIGWKSRLATQALVTMLMIEWGDLYVTNLGNLLGFGDLELGVFAKPFTLFATIGVINAINMCDGIDGLAGGLVAVALGLLATAAYLGGDMQSFHSLTLLICCVLSFLAFNYRFPKRSAALIFMGDAGSTFLGFAICWFGIYLSQKSMVIEPVAVPWIISIPIIDTLVVLVRRSIKKRSPFHADRQHMHHILLLAGLSVSKTSASMILLALILGGFALINLAMGVNEPILFILFLVLLLCYQWVTLRAWRAMKILKRLI